MSRAISRLSTPPNSSSLTPRIHSSEASPSLQESEYFLLRASNHAVSLQLPQLRQRTGKFEIHPSQRRARELVSRRRVQLCWPDRRVSRLFRCREKKGRSPLRLQLPSRMKNHRMARSLSAIIMSVGWDNRTNSFQSWFGYRHIWWRPCLICRSSLSTICGPAGGHILCS